MGLRRHPLPLSLAGSVLALLLMALAVAPAAGGLAWLRGGHLLPADLSRHDLLRSAYPQADHHGALATTKGLASDPASSEAGASAFALSGPLASVIFGLAAVLPSLSLLVWRLSRRPLPRGALLRLAGRSPAPALQPPR